AKTQEYFVYFKFFATQLWRKFSARRRSTNCAELPLQYTTTGGSLPAPKDFFKNGGNRLPFLSTCGTLDLSDKLLAVSCSLCTPTEIEQLTQRRRSL
ncbi:MAG: hypothetical protein LUH45_05460, partial [Clostridiales bacterium]|nr:hypothetical protein [Clostridiales bacterium]